MRHNERYSVTLEVAGVEGDDAIEAKAFGESKLTGVVDLFAGNLMFPTDPLPRLEEIDGV